MAIDSRNTFVYSPLDLTTAAVSVTGATVASTTFAAGGVGIRNVRDRLRLCFGAAASVLYDSRENIGTKVTIVLPAVRQEEQ